MSGGDVRLKRWPSTHAASAYEAGHGCRPKIGERVIAPRGRFRPPERDTGKKLRINDLIRISPIRLIDENNEQVGVIALDEAKQRAKTAGLDLVEVAPMSRPPVCRIMDYGKWKYHQKKKEQKAKAHAKQSELKGVRLRPKIDDHDLDIKVERAREFLSDSDKVQFVMLFRGREMAHQDLGYRTMREICDKLADVSKVEAAPKMMGRRMTMVLAPERKSTAPGGGGPAGGKPAGEAAAPAAPRPAPRPAPQPVSAE